MPSPPKPWERAGAGAGTAPIGPSTTSLPTATATTAPAPSSSAPPLPDRPAAFSSSSALTTTSPYSSSPGGAYSAYGAQPYSRLGMGGAYGGVGSSYGGYGGLGSYGGMGSSYGGMGSTYGGYGGLGSYGGMGSTYGSYGMGGMGMGGLGGMGMGMGMGGMGAPAIGPNGMPLPPQQSLTQTLEATTAQTFALLHGIVQTFGGVAQMVESTFVATHSSFFAMVGVVDQFGQLRNALGSVLGVFGLLRWLRSLLLGEVAGGGAAGGVGGAQMDNEFRAFLAGRPVAQGAGAPAQAAQPKASRKPLVLFLLAVFGIPYAMTKLINVLAARARAQQAALGPGAVPLVPGQLPPLDPAALPFARALYPFTASNPNELSLKENEIVAVTGKMDVRTGAEVDPRVEVEGDWWKGRTREGREGWFPKKWVEVLERRKEGEAKKVE